MDTNRIPKQALQYKPKGRRNIGRQRKRWRDQFHFEDQGTGNTSNPSFFFYLYIVYSQHAPLPSVILHALPDHLHTVLLVSYRIYIMYGSAVHM